MDTFERTPAAAAALLDELTALASRAAAAIATLRSPTVEWTAKRDESPVSAADRASQDIILAGLQTLLPGLPIVSEEAEFSSSPPGEHFALVDPLDGTKEFLAGRDDFTVNIALISHGTPTAGVVGAPALGLIWRSMAGCGAERLALSPGAHPDAAARRDAIRTRRRPSGGLTATVSRSHLDPATVGFLARHGVVERVEAGSALKFARLAEGVADLYPRLAQTSEWDIAAGHAVLTAAGGIVLTPDGAPLIYGHAERGYRVPGFVAWGDPTAASAG
jgi:3'(2'), 5'-bisphosphate nucleotidase